MFFAVIKSHAGTDQSITFSLPVNFISSNKDENVMGSTTTSLGDLFYLIRVKRRWKPFKVGMNSYAKI